MIFHSMPSFKSLLRSESTKSESINSGTAITRTSSFYSRTTKCWRSDSSCARTSNNVTKSRGTSGSSADYDNDEFFRSPNFSAASETRRYKILMKSANLYFYKNSYFFTLGRVFYSLVVLKIFCVTLVFSGFTYFISLKEQSRVWIR